MADTTNADTICASLLYLCGLNNSKTEQVDLMHFFNAVTIKNESSKHYCNTEIVFLMNFILTKTCLKVWLVHDSVS